MHGLDTILSFENYQPITNSEFKVITVKKIVQGNLTYLTGTNLDPGYDVILENPETLRGIHTHIFVEISYGFSRYTGGFVGIARNLGVNPFHIAYSNPEYFVFHARSPNEFHSLNGVNHLSNSCLDLIETNYPLYHINRTLWIRSVNGQNIPHELLKNCQIENMKHENGGNRSIAAGLRRYLVRQDKNNPTNKRIVVYDNPDIEEALIQGIEEIGKISFKLD